MVALFKVLDKKNYYLEILKMGGAYQEKSKKKIFFNSIIYISKFSIKNF